MSGTGRRVIALFMIVLGIAAAGAGWVYYGRGAIDDLAEDDSADDEPKAGPDAGARHPKKAGKGRAATRKSAGSAPRPHPTEHHPVDYGPPGVTYEAAIAGNRQQVTIGAQSGAADLTDSQLAGPMRNGTFLDACEAPDSMHVQVKVAIREGRAVGVSVYANPPDHEVAACIDHAVRGLAWPVNPKMDSFTTNY